MDRGSPTQSPPGWGPSLPSAARISATHLSEIRSSSWRLGHCARNESYSSFACARFWAAVDVGIDRSFLPRGALRTSECALPNRELLANSGVGEPPNTTL